MGNKRSNGHYTAFFVLNRIFVVGLIMTTTFELLNLGSPPMGYAHENLLQCTYNTVNSLLRVFCTSMMGDIPPYLNCDIQILNISSHKIEKLHSNSLSPYKKLIYVCLDNNLFESIPESLFEEQHYLEVLDLKNNPIKYLPKTIFQQPHLRILYLSSSRLNDSMIQVDSVSSPLKFLELHHNDLTRLPDMGYMPLLTYLDVSSNKISNITTEELARFCYLQRLDVSNNPLQFEQDTCKCVTLQAWLNLRGIDFKPAFNCVERTAQLCEDIVFSEDTLTIYKECKNVLRMQEPQEYRTRYLWILIVTLISCFLVLMISVLYWIHRRNKRNKMLH